MPPTQGVHSGSEGSTGTGGSQTEPTKKRRAWTKREDSILIAEWERGYAYLSKQLGRTQNSIQARAAKLGVSLRGGMWTLQQIIQNTGYNWRQVYRAKDALRQKWKRVSKGVKRRKDGRGGSHYRVTEEQVEALVSYLANEKHKSETVWSVRHGPRCLGCKRDDKPHYCNGLCTRCFSKANWERVKKDPEKLARQRRWQSEYRQRKRMKKSSGGSNLVNEEAV